ncbi:uncharacterized protein Tco025E_02792 [Trypanosoma conorhini]|uniref:Uncharacterized protein n=1 Tax=Trypanosoma conorhini TaxID=83891 RepID=A0A3R7LGV4_9TRYP|nr:uncharacterized protein Tco025E_02792 [Trypanosoma conorhini]RNF23500.1 hypothetical protein Tco025E_02792 [Trypanosoma conorhini]
MAAAAGDIPVLADVVERPSGDGAEPRRTLRPIQAVVGSPFPRCLPDRSYGQRTADAPSRGEATRATRATAAGPAHGLTAHVQPAFDGGADSHADAAEMGLHAGAGAMASLARQHQWQANEFADLARGYYAVPLCPSGTEAAASPAPLQGEAYLELLLRFLCSTVRKHRECATAALRARLVVDDRLRERCAFGPGCAQLLRLLITELSSGHTVPCSAAAECLVWLLYDATAEVVEAVGEVGVPPTDAATRAEGAHQQQQQQEEEGVASGTGNEATFADLSEWMRSGEDKARALEQLGLTTSVMDALGVLPPTLAARLLLGGGVLSLPRVAVRVAADPRYAQFVAGRLGSVVAGATPLGEVVEELLLLRRVLHVKQACAALLPPLQEVLALFLRHVCAAPDEAPRCVSDVVACLAAFLVLRAFVRHGIFDVFHDLRDTLLTAVGVGACMPAEMWLLLTAAAPVETCGVELARVAQQTLLPRVQAVEDGVGDAAPPGHCAALLAALTSTHYLATYFTVACGAAETEALLGAAGETQGRVQAMLATCLLTATGLQRAFARVGEHRGVGAAATAPNQPPTTLNLRSFVEAAWASLNHARVRLMAAAHAAFPAVCCEASMGYAAALAAHFEQRCMGISQVAGHLPPDELCTMIEVAGFMRRHSRATPRDHRRQYTRDTYVAEVFILHGIAVTKHCLDAAPTMIAAMLGLPDDTEFGAVVRAPSPPLPLVALGQSLRRAVEQTQWPWFLFPLYDAELPCKSAWCAWLQQALGAHEGVKRLLRWDLVLCHALKWAVLHRATQRDWGSQHDGADGAPCGENADLVALLEVLCGGVLPSSGGVLSDAASDALKALTAYAAPHAEESMSRRLLEALAVAAAACPPPVAVVLARLIAHTVMTGEDTRHRNFADAAAPAIPTAASAGASDGGSGVVFASSVSSERLLRRWAATGRLSEAAPLTGAVAWELGDFVELLQTAAERRGGRILQHLLEGAARAYLRQHHPLTAFERQVLCRTQAELAWCPACLQEALAEPQGQQQ